MNTHTMNAEPQRLGIYDPRRDRMISLNPYKAKAKEIYRHYIEDLGFDRLASRPRLLREEWILSQEPHKAGED